MKASPPQSLLLGTQAAGTLSPVGPASTSSILCHQSNFDMVIFIAAVLTRPPHLFIICLPTLVVYCCVTNYPQNCWLENNSDHILSLTIFVDKEFGKEEAGWF